MVEMSSTIQKKHTDTRFYRIVSGLLGWLGVIATFTFVLQVVVLVAEGISPITGLTAWGFVWFSYGVTGVMLALYTTLVAVRHMRSTKLPTSSVIALPYIRELFYPFWGLAVALTIPVRRYRKRHIL